MAAVKKIKRAPAKRGRPAKKIVARRGRPAKAKPVKPAKPITRLQAAETALEQALAEQAQVVKAFKKVSEKVAKAQARVDAHRGREQAKKELIPVFTKAA